MHKQVKVHCMDAWIKKTRCKGICTLCFPDTEEMREIARPLLAAMIKECPLRECLKAEPRFVSFEKDLA